MIGGQASRRGNGGGGIEAAGHRGSAEKGLGVWGDVAEGQQGAAVGGSATVEAHIKSGGEHRTSAEGRE